MTTKTQTIGEKSADTLVIENRLRNSEVGDIIEYSDLSRLLGRSVTEFCRSNISTARNTLSKEHIHFGVIRGLGLRRLTADEAVAAGREYVDRARRTSHRGCKHLARVEFDKLSDESKKDHLTTSAQLGAMCLLGKSSSTKRIASAIKESSEQLPIGKTLQLFGS